MELANYVVDGQMSLFDMPVAQTSEDWATQFKPITKADRKANAEFGEHIGGARKELFGGSIFSTKALSEFNDGEIKKYIVKDKLWKKPDYEKMVKEDGVDILVAFALKKIRDAIPPHPSYSFAADPHESAEVYVKYVNAIKTMTDGIRDMEELKSLRYNAITYKVIKLDSSRGISRYRPDYSEFGTLSNAVMCNALVTEDWVLNSYQHEMKKIQFCVAKNDKIPTGYSVTERNGQFIVRRKYTQIATAETRAEAVAIAQQSAAEGKKAAKSKFIPPQLEHLRRTGLPDHRNGRHVEGNDFITDFGIRGGEFGNWMNELDAQGNLDACYDAFCDLADALGIKKTDISVGGKLNIAFGARGKGSAVAHYEPLRQVINLTKLHGAGSLAHEMFHAFDFILGNQFVGKAFTELYSVDKDKLPVPAHELISALMYKPLVGDDLEAAKNRKRAAAEASFKIHMGYCVSYKQTTMPTDIDAIVVRALNEVKGVFGFDPEQFGRDLMRDFEIAGHAISESCLDGIIKAAEVVSNPRVSGFTKTDFYLQSVKMDKCYSKDAHGYWSSVCEMFARAGACYVTDKLKEAGAVNDYLSGHSECAIGTSTASDGTDEKIVAIPQGEERKYIDEMFDKFFQFVFA